MVWAEVSLSANVDPVFPAQFFEKTTLSLQDCLGQPCQKSIDNQYAALFLD